MYDRGYNRYNGRDPVSREPFRSWPFDSMRSLNFDFNIFGSITMSETEHDPVPRTRRMRSVAELVVVVVVAEVADIDHWAWATITR